MQFAVVDTADWIRGEVEPGGDEEKFWLTAPSDDRRGHWLFKPCRVKSLKLSKARQQLGDQPDILVRGDDWAEKISYELSRLRVLWPRLSAGRGSAARSPRPAPDELPSPADRERVQRRLETIGWPVDPYR